MPITDLWPVIIPGILVQVMIQVFYIRHCRKNTRLSMRQKWGYMLSIAVFSLPATAIYLINNRDKSAARDDNFHDIDIDNYIQQGIFILLIVAFEVFALRVIADNAQNEHYLLIISLLAYSFVIMLINNLLINKHHHLLYYLLPATQLLIAMPIQYLDITYYAQYILVIITAGIINKYPMPLAKTYSIAAFCALLVGSTAKALKYYYSLDMDDIVSYLYVNTLIFLLVVMAFYMLKKQLLTNRRLEAALQRVREQAGQIEKIGALAERSRITAEIHDTVGHTLTSAVISIEAAESMLEKNTVEAAKKLTLAKEQVKHGLNDIRYSIRTIRMDGEESFELALGNMLEDIRRTTCLTINSIVELKSELLSVQQGVLLLAIKECVTNALKHGKCTEVDILVQEYKGEIHLTFSDNGEGKDYVVPGMGLSIMKERVQSIGGVLQIDSAKRDGFTVHISIPVGIEQGGNSI